MRIIKYFAIILIFAFNSLSFGQEKEILADINGNKIYLDEFQSKFLGSLSEEKSIEDITITDLKEYLDLLIKFTLKVKDGISRGLLNSADIQEDIESFKKKFILSFYIDKKILNPYLQQVYERRKYEYRASHILINLPVNPQQEDSIRVYEKFYKILNRLNQGEDFAQVALEMSDDPSVYMNKGDVYYFTSGRLVPEFEDAVYSMEVGEINQTPVRTIFGLHIIKVTDKRPRVEAVRAAHIFIKNDLDSTGEIKDSLKTANFVLNILEKLKNGEEFSTLAKEFSDDIATASRGGEFGFITRGQLIPALDSVIFNLKAGEISKPIKTQGGWHILKVYEIKPLEDSEAEKEELKNEIKRGYYYKSLLTNFYNNSKEKYRFQINDDNINFLLTKFDTSVAFSRYNLDSIFKKSELNFELASFTGGAVTVNDFIDNIKQNRDYSYYKPTKTNIINIITEIATNEIIYLSALSDNIESDDEYRNMLENYENGLIVFKIDQQELMPKVKITEKDIENYYEENIEKFKISDDKGERYKSLDEVKPEINNILLNTKYKEVENQYIGKLKSKYEVTVYEEKLNKVLENLKQYNEEQ